MSNPKVLIVLDRGSSLEEVLAVIEGLVVYIGPSTHGLFKTTDSYGNILMDGHGSYREAADWCVAKRLAAMPEKFRVAR